MNILLQTGTEKHADHTVVHYIGNEESLSSQISFDYNSPMIPLFGKLVVNIPEEIVVK